MGDVARGGRTVLFVSHNMAAIENLCPRTVLIENGKLKCDDVSTAAIAEYLRGFAPGGVPLQERTDRQGSQDLTVQFIEIRDGEGRPADVVMCGQDVQIWLHFVKRPGYSASDVRAAVSAETHLGVPVFLHHSRLTKDCFGPLPEKGAFVCRISRLPLPAGHYSIGFSVMRGEGYLDMVRGACELQVVEGDFYGSGEVPPPSHGLCLLDARWTLGETSQL